MRGQSLVLAKLLQVIGTLAQRSSLLRSLPVYIKRTVSSLGLPYTVHFRDPLVYFCDINGERCLIAEIGNGIRLISPGGDDLYKTFLQLAVRYLGTKGQKRVVSLYVRSDNYLVKLTPTGMDKLVVIVSRAAQLLIVFSITIIFALLVTLGLPLLISTVLTILSLNLLMLILPEAIVRVARLPALDSEQIYKLEIAFPENVKKSLLGTIVRTLQLLTKVQIDSVNRLLSFIGEIAESASVSIKRVRVNRGILDEIRKRGIKILILSSDIPDAFSIQGVRKYIILTTRLLALLEEHELEAVIAHELGHIARAHIPVILAVASVLYAVVPLLVKFTLMLRLDVLSTVIIVTILILSLFLLSWALIRRLELDADEFAARLVGSHVLAESLISVAWKQIVLELERPRLTSLLNFFSTHPLVIKRILRVFSE